MDVDFALASPSSSFSSPWAISWWICHCARDSNPVGRSDSPPSLSFTESSSNHVMQNQCLDVGHLCSSLTREIQVCASVFLTEYENDLYGITHRCCRTIVVYLCLNVCDQTFIYYKTIQLKDLMKTKWLQRFILWIIPQHSFRLLCSWHVLN